jgi:hypothetical protein
MKYTPQELRFLAIDYLQARECGDIRCMAVVTQLMINFGISFEQCEGMIAALAA